MKRVITKSLKLNKNQIQKIIENSGYLLEQRVCPKIEKQGFFVDPNVEFQDQDTGKSREIDIYALDMRSLYRSDFDDVFNVILLIECKTNSTPVIFFTQKNPIPKGVFGHIVISGYPEGIYEKEFKGESSIEDYFHFEKFHHNFNVEFISRQFCQLKPKIVGKGSPKESVEWFTTHEGLFESIEKLVKAVEYYIKEQKENPIFDKYTRDLIRLTIIYPVLLFSGKIYEYQIRGRKSEIRDAKHIVFYKSIASKLIRGDYHIDVVQETFLDNFLKIINKETEITTSKLKRNRRLLKANVERNYQEQFKSKLRNKK